MIVVASHLANFSIALIRSGENFKVKLRCIIDFERSRIQRQGYELLLGKWILLDGFSLPSSLMVFLLQHV